MSSESSLTTPGDRDLQNKWKPEVGKPPLTGDEFNNAVNELNVDTFIKKFPKIDRTYADPPIQLQTYGLFSFVPAKGATPDKDGFFGFAKLRGNFSTELEAQQKAEELIMNTDSYHDIFHSYVGRPFPITTSIKHALNTDEVDIRKKTTKCISESIIEKRKKEQNDIEEIKEKEKKLVEDTKQENVDPYENYITLRVKKAQLSWTYLEHMKKIDEIKKILLKTNDDIVELDKKNPKFNDEYYEKYMKARKDAGIKDTSEDGQESFMKFLVEDAVLPGIDLNKKSSSE